MEQVKKSKVTLVTANGSWDSKQYGTFYRFEIQFDNGDIGEYNSKTNPQTKFVVGQEIDYQLITKDVNGVTKYQIKPIQAQQQQRSFQDNPEKEARICRMSVLKCTTDLIVNNKLDISQLTSFSKNLERYVMTGEDTISTIMASSVRQLTESDLSF